jgi:hypothetical protein
MPGNLLIDGETGSAYIKPGKAYDLELICSRAFIDNNPTIQRFISSNYLVVVSINDNKFSPTSMKGLMRRAAPIIVNTVAQKGKLPETDKVIVACNPVETPIVIVENEPPETLKEDVPDPIKEEEVVTLDLPIEKPEVLEVAVEQKKDPVEEESIISLDLSEAPQGEIEEPKKRGRKKKWK